MAGYKGSILSNRRLGAILRRSASTAAMAAILTSAAASAQDNGDAGGEASDEDVDTIVVQGIRQSLQDAQDIKRASDVFVDAITASDIGALPDRSVSEALQRVPGVSVLRFAGPDDPDHFAVEGSGVIVRGLPFVRSELNGRDVFGAGVGGGLGFEDVSPELLGSVQVFKNQSADLIEGGLAGTVDLRTRLPFDADKRVLALTADYTYSDFAEEGTPSFSGLYSDRFETGIGEFGFMVNASHNELRSRADATAVASFRPYTDNGDGTFDRFQFDDDGSFPDDRSRDSTVFIPDGGAIRTQQFDRERNGIALAGQWESIDQTVLATVQFLRSDSDVTWGERVVESTVDSAPNVEFLNDDFAFDDDGVLTRGTITENVGWRGNNTLEDGNLLPLNGIQQAIVTRERQEDEVTTDLAFNVKWTPTDQLSFNFDGQFIDATTTVQDVSIFFANFANVSFDNTGDFAEVSFLAPEGTDDDYFLDRNNYYFRAKMDHLQDNEAEEEAFRADVEYDFATDGFLRAVRFGGRYSDQDATVRNSVFNWGNVSEIWTNINVDTGETNPRELDGRNTLLRLDDPRLAGLISDERFGNLQRGEFNPGIGQVPVWTGPLAADYTAFVNTIQPILQSVGRGDTGSGTELLGLRPGADITTGFIPSEISEVSVETLAFYGRADFGVDFDNGMSLTGNVGVRYVEDEVESNSTFNAQPFSTILNGQTIAQFCDPNTPRQNGIPGLCTQDIEAIGELFGDGVQQNNGFVNEFDNWLPSLNMKFNVTDEFLIRFGLSRSLVRPNNQQLRADVNLAVRPDIPNPGGQAIFQGIAFGSETDGNPFLEPITADQIDLSAEWYFADEGSLTLAFFEKNLNDYWTLLNEEVPFTQNGVTQQIIRRETINAEEDVRLRGFELGYQQFYDFLPAPFDGLGTQFNYTYVDANGVADVDNTITSIFPRNSELLERVSEHQFNLVGLYAKGPLEARLAFNWRDDFLLTRRDVIFPFNSIFQEATGQLDGSIFYDLNENVTIGVQAVNLLDDITETTQTIAPDGTRGPRAFNRNDRRFSFVLRANY